MPLVKQASFGARSFSCPHCGALADQAWFDCQASKRPTPPRPMDRGQEYIKIQSINPFDTRDAAHRALLKTIAGFPWLGEFGATGPQLMNMTLSQCFSCTDFTVWMHEKIVFPAEFVEIAPNEDLPADIAADFKEARSIVNASPRGAAALLRLCIQKLCKHLGEPGENINSDIGALVGRGLPPKLQRALDSVRVIGNEAVHPGTLNLVDDRETALALFILVNLVADAMVSQPKRVDEVYAMLPQGKRDAIDKRDAGSGSP